MALENAEINQDIAQTLKTVNEKEQLLSKINNLEIKIYNMKE